MSTGKWTTPVLLRWSQTFYVRRSVYGDVLEKAFDFVKHRIDAGHTFVEPSEGMRDALRVIRGTIRGGGWGERFEYEKLRMAHISGSPEIPRRG